MRLGARRRGVVASHGAPRIAANARTRTRMKARAGTQAGRSAANSAARIGLLAPARTPDGAPAAPSFPSRAFSNDNEFSPPTADLAFA
ncbi:conserved hypothetical protein [Burkholderia pseudomallei MSHR346]|nr:conserved hypothetical protein [Burkholderia pseudomallei MSHR346]